MCLELYHPEMPITVQYENENIQFIAHNKFISRHMFAIRNDGNLPLDFLFAIYPRNRYGQTVPLEGMGPEDITDKLDPNANSLLEVLNEGTSIKLTQPDPNRPQFDREPIIGQRLPNNSISLELPSGICDDDGVPFEHCLNILRSMGTTCWKIKFKPGTELVPGETRWFWWVINPPENGVTNGVTFKDTVLKRNVTYHQFASPLDVRRTLAEYLETGLRVSEKHANTRIGSKRAESCRKILKALGLRYERRVNIQYYELSIWCGDPTRQLPISWQMERDLRLRSHSPRSGIKRLNEPEDQIVYEWKSGTILQPDHSWKDEGFVLHLTLAHD